MVMRFAKPRLVRFNNNAVSDHNRSSLSIEVERIENKKRMANGMLRKYWIADKRTYSMSWDMLPNTIVGTVDGFWGADELEAFYISMVGEFDLELTFGNAAVQTKKVMFTDFSKSLLKRGRWDFYDVSLTLEEV